MATKTRMAVAVEPPVARGVLRRCLSNENVRAVLLLIAILHVCFLPYIWGDRTFLNSARDVPSVLPSGAWQGKTPPPLHMRQLDHGAPGWLSEPYAKLIQHQYLVERTPPVWNPYQGYGAPLAAAMQQQPFNPLYAAMSAICGPRTYNFYILGRLLLAGLFAFWFFRLLVGEWGALAGAIIYMFSGYFILYLTMPHLSVDILAPAALLGVELLLVQRYLSGTAITAGVTWLAIVGGMPESAFLILAFSYFYFAFRVITHADLRSTMFRSALRVISASAYGLALSAFLIFPFVEFMGVSFDLRQPIHTGGHFTGLRHDVFGLSICTYVTPLIFGPPWSSLLPAPNGWSGVRGYFGIVPVLLAVLAVFGAVRGRGTVLQRRLVLFFGAAAIVMVLKRYGVNPVNWIGALPFARLINFEKYQESLLALAVASLVAIGTQYAVDRRVGLGSLAVGLSGALGLLGVTAYVAGPEVLKDSAYNHVFVFALSLAVVLLLLVSVVILFVIAWIPRAVKPVKSTAVVGAVVISFVALEMSTNYIIPIYYYLGRLPSIQDDPFAGAPYIDYLRKNTNGRGRVFASEGILMPNWSSAFHLFDIRNLDAMYYNKYFKFVRTFMPAPNASELVDRFTGTGGRYDFRSPLEQRLLQLSSVESLVRQQPHLENGEMIRSIVDANRGRVLPGKESHIRDTFFSIQGDSRPVLFEHPPYERLPYPVVIDETRTKLRFAIAMDPVVYKESCGDGVAFHLEARNAEGTVGQLFHRYIDPKRNPAERRWVEATVDLSTYVGKEIELLFSTSPGPKGDTCADWAGWGAIRFGEESLTDAPPPVRLVYDQEVKIYRFGPTLPRASIFHHAVVARDEDDTLRLLASPDLDVLRTVVLNRAELNDSHQARLASLGQSEAPAGAAEIESYESTRVRIKAKLLSPGLLMLNDTNYPGWKAYVDGNRATVLSADYLFRGVLLDAGTHTVEFRYESDAYRYGSVVSATAFAGGSIWTLLLIRRRRIPDGPKRTKPNQIQRG